MNQSIERRLRALEGRAVTEGGCVVHRFLGNPRKQELIVQDWNPETGCTRPPRRGGCHHWAEWRKKMDAPETGLVQ